MKQYNALALDMDKDEPSYSNDKADFWLVEIDKKHNLCLYAVRERVNGDRNYILATGDGKPLRVTKLLEDASFYFDMYSICKDKKWVN